MRSHLGASRLQRVVEHIETEADRDEEWHGCPPGRRSDNAGKADQQYRSAAANQTFLPEPPNQRLYREAIQQSAQTESCDDQTDRAVAEIEALLEIRAEKREAPVEQESFDADRGDDHAHPAIGEQFAIARE